MQRSEAAMHSQPLKVEHGPVGVEPPEPVVPPALVPPDPPAPPLPAEPPAPPLASPFGFRLPPQPERADTTKAPRILPVLRTGRFN